MLEHLCAENKMVLNHVFVVHHNDFLGDYHCTISHLNATVAHLQGKINSNKISQLNDISDQ